MLKVDCRTWKATVRVSDALRDILRRDFEEKALCKTERTTGL